MMAFRQKGKRYFDTKVPTETGEWVKRATGTMDRVTARKIDDMIGVLSDKHAWDLLGRVTRAKNAMSLRDLYALWVSTPVTRWLNDGEAITPSPEERTAYVRAQLSSVDLSPEVNEFEKAMKGPQGVSDDTAEHYVSAVRLLIPKDEFFPSTRLTPATIREWLDEMEDVTSGTVRKRGIGMHRFINWLRDRGKLSYDPMAEIKLPEPGDPLCHYLELPDVVRLSEASHGQMKHFELILAGTALEVSTALQVRVRAVSKSERDIRAPGTKTYNRDRVVRVADFAWDALLELMNGKHPDSLLFDSIPHRFSARDAHSEARQALVDKGHRVYAFMSNGEAHDYTLRDHRHTWAVRYVRANVPIEAIARQLGNTAAIVAKVYGRFAPRKEERDMYERMAANHDRKVLKIRKGKSA